MLLLVAILGAGAIWYFFFHERARPYDIAAYVPDTKIVRRESRLSKFWYLGLGAGSDRDVLEVRRGCPHSTVTTAHGWDQSLTLEMAKLQVGTVLDVGQDDVRVTYHSYWGRRFWDLRPGTALGTVRIHAVSEDNVTASYEITLTAISRAYGGGNVLQQVTFQGHRVFNRAPRPEPAALVGDAVQEAHNPDNIHRAANRGDLEGLRKFLAEGIAVNVKADTFLEEGWTPLHYAAFGGRDEVVKLLLERGASVDARSQAGTTALHEAAWGGHAQIAELLIANGADVNARDSRGQTPLDMARQFTFHQPHEAVAKLLRSRGAKTSIELGPREPSPAEAR